MHSSGNTNHSPVIVAALLLFELATALSPAATANQVQQTPSSTLPQKPARHDSVEVVAHLSPEEVEDGKLNEAYEAIEQLRRKSDCTTEIVQRYKSEVILLAEKASFNVPKNKFLFLAKRSIGNCYLSRREYANAEASFREIMAYAPVWPGTDDSAYPINFRQIATAQMGQEHWTDAEQSLLKSISLFDPQIAAAEGSSFEFTRTEHNSYIRGSQVDSIALLAVVYLREGRVQDALTTIEKAYAEVIKHNLAPQFHNEVVEIGKAISAASEDSQAQRTWLLRNLIR